MSKYYSIDYVFSRIGEEALKVQTVSKGSKETINVDGFNVKRRSLRYAVFYQKGTRCVCCGKEGTHFKLDSTIGTMKKHFNLYADDGTLITKDHIIPKHWGGRDHIDNLQPMCKTCNENKGSHTDLEFDGYTATDVQDPEHVRQYPTFEDAVVAACNFKWITSHEKLRRATIVRRTVEVTLDLQKAIESGQPYMNYIWKKERFKVKGSSWGTDNKELW